MTVYLLLDVFLVLIVSASIFKATNSFVLRISSSLAIGICLCVILSFLFNELHNETDFPKITGNVLRLPEIKMHPCNVEVYEN